MTSVIGHEDNGWVSATMDNGKLIEHRSAVKDIHRYSTSERLTPKKSISEQYAESMLGREVVNNGGGGPVGKTSNGPSKVSELLLPCGPGLCGTYSECRDCGRSPYPKWAPLVSQLEQEKSQLKELNKPQPIPPVSSTANSPKTLDSSHKIPVNLCPASAIIAIALVIAQGHKKPGRTIYNWRDKSQKISYMDYHAAALRHLLKSIDGSNFDPELSELAGVPVRHDWAAMSCLAIIEDARQAGTLFDDRPVKGGAEEFLESLMVKK